MMPVVTIATGAILIVLSAVLYAGSPPADGWFHTSWIPGIFGVVLVALGALAFRPRLRMHVMHVAVLVGLVGLVVPAWRALPDVPALVQQGRVVKEVKGEERDMTRATVGQLVMGGTCLVFVGLCVTSFVQARLLRKKQGEPAST